jgi:hypothetical protein
MYVMNEELKYGETILIPDGLHEDTADLVVRFAEALAEKLYLSQKKYNYQNEWISPDWMDSCRTQLRSHLNKGDPIDVAAYCAFLWYHKEPTFKQQIVDTNIYE